jgi:hypothetical protein
MGLLRVGIVGMGKALNRVEEAGIREREAIVDTMMQVITEENFVPDEHRAQYRTVLWREYLRNKGEDFSAFYSEVPVTVKADEGEDRDRFVEILISVFAEYELKPVIAFEPPGDEHPCPALIVNDEPLVHGLISKKKFKDAIRKNISDW